MAQDIHVLNVRLPDEVIKWIDSLVKSGIYNSRSEALREFIRESADGTESRGELGEGVAGK